MSARVAPSFISFKLSFNKRAKVLLIDPAARKFGDPSSGYSEVIGVRIQILEGKVFFQAATQAEVDVNPYNVVEISDRDRGGAIAIIEGQNAASLQRALFNPCGSSYFVLQSTSTGWMEAVPHDDPVDEPDRFTPSVRVWNQKPSGRRALQKIAGATAAKKPAPPVDFSAPAVPKPTQILKTVRMLAENLTSVAETSGSDVKRLTDTLLEAQRIINSLVSPLQILAAPLPEHARLPALVAEPKGEIKAEAKAESKPRQARKIEAAPTIAETKSTRSTSTLRDEEGELLTRDREPARVPASRRSKRTQSVAAPAHDTSPVQTSRSASGSRGHGRRADFFR